MSISQAYLSEIDKKYNKKYNKHGLYFNLAEGKGVITEQELQRQREEQRVTIYKRLLERIIKVHQPITNYAGHYIFLEGGRAGGKSYSVAYYMLAQTFNSHYSNNKFLCMRKVQESIEESVYSLLKSLIIKENLEDYFDINKVDITNKVTNVRIVFKGCNTIAALLGIKSSDEVAAIWIEEAQGLTYEDFKVIIPTFVRFEQFKFIFTYNRFLEEDPVLTEYKRRETRALHIYSTYLDNEHTNEETIREAESLKAISEAEYNHVWLGLPGGKYIAFPTLSLEHNGFYDPYFKPDNYPWYISMDWGFSDWCAVGFYCLVDEKIIIKFDEMKFNHKTPQEAAALILDRMLAYRRETYVKGFIDPSAYRRDRGEVSIADEMAGAGLFLDRAYNDRAVGFQRLRRMIDKQQLLIGTNCSYFWQTVPNIVMSDKKPGDIHQDGVDDHCYDETRYATMGIIDSFAVV